MVLVFVSNGSGVKRYHTCCLISSYSRTTRSFDLSPPPCKSANTWSASSSLNYQKREINIKTLIRTKKDMLKLTVHDREGNVGFQGRQSFQD